MLRKYVSAGIAAAVISGLGAVGMAAPSNASGGHKIKIEDDCEPASFNAAVGPGTCIGDGETTFAAFIAEVAATRQAKDWRFDPSMLTIARGRPVILENEGGETHTFTLVKAFGGGFVPILNQLSGNPKPAAECANMMDGNLVPKPPSAVNVFVAADHEAAFRTARLKRGKYMFQCCVHPWMRVILTVR
jgi:plastocyanin